MINNRILLLINLLIITILRYYFEDNTPLSKASLSATLITVLVATIVYFSNFEKNRLLRFNFLTLSFMIVVGIIIVHFFDYLAFVVGEHDTIKDVHFIDINYVNTAALCSCASLICFMIGYIAVHKGLKKHRFICPTKARLLEWLMPVFLIVFYVNAGDVYFKGGYGEISNSTGLPLLATLSQTFFISCQIAISVIVMYQRKKGLRQYIRSYSLIYYLSLLCYAYLVLSSGDRGPLFQTSICYAAPYFFINSLRLKPIPGFFLLCSAALVLALLGTVRNFDGDLNLAKLKESQEFRTERFQDENIIFTSTAELSNCVRAYHVLYYYCRTEGCIYGLGLLNQILGLIPGLRYILYPLIGIDADTVTTAVITTQLLFQDHGMGSTCIGDIYFNFGFSGTLIVFVLFGAFIRKMDLTIYSDYRIVHPFWVCLILSYFMFGIYIGRGYLTSSVNVFAYSCMFLYFEKLFQR